MTLEDFSARLSVINGGLGGAVTCIDCDGIIREWVVEQGKLRQFIPVDVTGKSIYETMSDGEAATLMWLIKHTLKTGEQTEHVHRFVDEGSGHSDIRKVRIDRMNKSRVKVTVSKYP